MRPTDAIAPSEFVASDGVDDWRVLGDGALAFFRASFAESAAFVAALATVPGVDDHPPAVDVRRDGVTVRLVTVRPDLMGLTHRDLEQARAISALARDHALPPDPASVQGFLVVPGATDVARVMPFWRAVLGYEPRPDSPDEDLVDPHDRGAPFWFEPMDRPRGDGGGSIHVAVWVPPEVAEARVAAAVAAGGRIVRDEEAPSWWTLADAAGNEADVATIVGRG